MMKNALKNSMNNNPLVSIIVPIYNVEAFIEECINSLISQSYKNIEIVCVDDGSKDSSITILKNIAQYDRRISIYHQQNRGLSAARNTAISKAKGEYLCFVDSDDILSQTAIEDNIYFFFQNNNVDIVCFPMLVNWTLRKREKLIDLYPGKTLDNYSFRKELLTRKFNCSMSAKIYKASLFNSHSFCEGRYFEDAFYFISNLSKIINCVFSSHGCYFYRYNPGSIINNGITDKKFYDFIDLSELFVLNSGDFVENENIMKTTILRNKVVLFRFLNISQDKFLDIYDNKFYVNQMSLLSLIKTSNLSFVEKYILVLMKVFSNKLALRTFSVYNKFILYESTLNK
ncbi:MAG: glycosyltransferase family 2 protein [Bacteroidales bacterium]